MDMKRLRSDPEPCVYHEEHPTPVNAGFFAFSQPSEDGTGKDQLCVISVSMVGVVAVPTKERETS